MPSYIVETYVPRGSGAEVTTAERAREAARTLAAAGRRIQFLRSTFLPSDELCFLVFEAESPAVVSEATARAAIDFARIVEAVE
ncbi:MAG: nickel-binding protein [Actinomycetota bacterium]